MRCEIYGSPTSTHYTQIVGHIADDGNIYNSRNSEAGAEDLRRCVGHIAGDGNVYATAKGFGEAAGNAASATSPATATSTTFPAAFPPTRPLRRPRGGGRQGLYHAGRALPPGSTTAWGRCWAARANRVRRRCFCF